MGWCLNFKAHFMKNKLLELEKIKLWGKKQHFVENKTEIMQHILKLQYICVLPNIRGVPRGMDKTSGECSLC